jgi:hypothetical protein
MTPEMKKHLEAVVVAIANEQSADAKAEFSKYLRLKTQSILLGEKEHDDEEDKKEVCPDCKCDPCECDDKKKDKKDDKKDEKKDAKEDKKDEKKDDDEDEEKC